MSRNLAVIGVDPGLTTGLALFIVDDRVRFSSGLEVARWDLRDSLVALTCNHLADTDVVIGCERYTITASTLKKSRQSDAQEAIGTVQDVARRCGAEVLLQSASDAKNLVSNDLLRRLGWLSRGYPHMNDARRHALRVISVRRSSAYAELIKCGTISG